MLSNKYVIISRILGSQSNVQREHLKAQKHGFGQVRERHNGNIF